MNLNLKASALSTFPQKRVGKEKNDLQRATGFEPATTSLGS